MLLIIENNNSINRIDRKLSKSIILFNIKINRDCSSISDNAIIANMIKNKIKGKIKMSSSSGYYSFINYISFSFKLLTG